MAKLTDEHRKLEALAGSWFGEETIFPTPWHPDGGEAIGHFEARIDLDGFYLITDYEQEVAGKITFRGHGVYGWSPMRQCYTMHWFDTMGETPPAQGQWEGDALTFENQGEHGARYIYKINGPDNYTLRIEQSQDGETWEPFLEGTYTRTT